MATVSMETTAYAKILLHATKYLHCAVNGVLLADASKIKEGGKIQELDIVDSHPLFHHSHYLSPMAEIALTQIEAIAQANDQIIAGYYAACENFNDNTVDKCPGQKVAEKIVEYFPSAIFAVVDNKKIAKFLKEPAINLYSYSEGKWKLRDTNNKVLFKAPYVLETVSDLILQGVHMDLVDFDNFLDDPTQDLSNRGIQKLIASISASNTNDYD